jgi:hypothetical protein
VQSQYYEIHTLIDITNTKMVNPKGNTIPYQQMQNLNSIMQILGMRTQPMHITVIEDSNTEISDWNDKKVWTMKFSCETDDAWTKDGDNVHYLNLDLNGTPVITGLTETVSIEPACFVTNGAGINTYITFIPWPDKY